MVHLQWAFKQDEGAGTAPSRDRAPNSRGTVKPSSARGKVLWPVLFPHSHEAASAVCGGVCQGSCSHRQWKPCKGRGNRHRAKAGGAEEGP